VQLLCLALDFHCAAGVAQKKHLADCSLKAKLSRQTFTYSYSLLLHEERHPAAELGHVNLHVNVRVF